MLSICLDFCLFSFCYELKTQGHISDNIWKTILKLISWIFTFETVYVLVSVTVSLLAVSEIITKKIDELFDRVIFYIKTSFSSSSLKFFNFDNRRRKCLKSLFGYYSLYLEIQDVLNVVQSHYHYTCLNVIWSICRVLLTMFYIHLTLNNN